MCPEGVISFHFWNLYEWTTKWTKARATWQVKTQRPSVSIGTFQLIYTLNPVSESNDFKRLLWKSTWNEGKYKVFQEDLPFLFILEAKSFIRQLHFHPGIWICRQGDAIHPDHCTNWPQTKSVLKSMAKHPSNTGVNRKLTIKVATGCAPAIPKAMPLGPICKKFRLKQLTG